MKYYVSGPGLRAVNTPRDTRHETLKILTIIWRSCGTVVLQLSEISSTRDKDVMSNIMVHDCFLREHNASMADKAGPPCELVTKPYQVWR